MTQISKSVYSRGAVVITAALLTGTCFLSTTSIAVAEQGVNLRGVLIEFADQVNENPGSPFGPSGYTIDQVCDAVEWDEGGLGRQLKRMVDTINSAMYTAGSPITLDSIQQIPGAPTRADIERDIATAKTEICDSPEPQTSVQAFVLNYTSCRMGMYTPTHAMVISLPSNSSSANMLVADHVKQEVVFIEMTSQLNATSEFIGSGWSEMTDMVESGATSEHIGYATKQYTFDYDSGLGMPGLGEVTTSQQLEENVVGNDPTALGNLVSVNSSGKVWVADSAPGVDIVHAFYQNLTNRVEANSTSGFFGGMIKNLAIMLEKGMPLETLQTTTSKVMGRTMVTGDSWSIVTSVNVRDLHQNWCMDQPIPEGYTVTDPLEGMEGSNGGADMPSSAEMTEAMQEYQKAMEQMTPEQQQMMEQMGLGSAMAAAGGAVATNPGGDTTSDAAAGLTENSNSNCAGSGVSSSELTTDNMTESVQKHLAALGYETGNTNGDESLMTTVSISQFQAENGKEVSGEISPQLLGALAAEVDKCN